MCTISVYSRIPEVSPKILFIYVPGIALASWVDLLSSCVGMQTYLEHSANTQTFTAQSSGTEVNNCTLDVEVGWHSSSLFPSMPSIALAWDVEEKNVRSSFGISSMARQSLWGTCNVGSPLRCRVSEYKMLVKLLQKQCSQYKLQIKWT